MKMTFYYVFNLVRNTFHLKQAKNYVEFNTLLRFSCLCNRQIDGEI